MTTTLEGIDTESKAKAVVAHLPDPSDERRSLRGTAWLRGVLPPPGTQRCLVCMDLAGDSD